MDGDTFDVTDRMWIQKSDKSDWSSLDLKDDKSRKPIIDPKASIALDNKAWYEASAQLISNPGILSHHEKLVEASESNNGKGISKTSSKEEIELLKISYENILEKYPLLINYWLRYATWCLKVESIESADLIYQRALCFLGHSVDLWTSYLSFKIDTISNNLQDVLNLFEEARFKVGYNYYAFEFYKLYLSFLEGYSHEIDGFKIKYFALLRMILEVPLYHYDYFYDIMFNHIGSMNEETLHYLVSRHDISNFTNQDLKNSSLKLKKIFTDAYITIQFKVYQLFHFEKNIKRNYFSDHPLSKDELTLWENYLNSVELNYPQSFIIQLYERALIPTACYSKFWVRYVDFFLSKKKYLIAKEILKRARRICPDHSLTIKLVDLEFACGNYCTSRDIVIQYMQSNPFVPIPIYAKLLSIERFFHNSDDEYILQLFSTVINETKCDWFFQYLLYYRLKSDLVIAFLEDCKRSFQDSDFFKSAYSKIVAQDITISEAPYNESLSQFVL